MLRTAALACFLLAGSAAAGEEAKKAGQETTKSATAGEANKTVEESKKPEEEATKPDPPTPSLRGQATPGGASGQSVGWKYFKFTTKKCKGGADSDSVQLSEIYFYTNGQRIPAAGVTASDPLGYSPDGQDATKAVDGNVQTKWLDFQKQYMVITYQTPQSPTTWSFVTGNDQDERDPMDFTMEVSEDNQKWTLVTEVSGFSSADRTAETRQFTISTNDPSGGQDGGSSDGGCGGGCVFLIIFFAGGFVYFAAGFAFNHQKRELRGVEAIPQVAFWKDLPFLVKDGGLFVVGKITGRGQYTAV
eukprot:Hpha_TRINITY_DN16787_c2_g2::TRINITY_DN16787_c2_g2_i1::g.76115::m.76115